jgi:transposase
MRWLSPYFPRSRGIPRVDDRRVLSGIISVIRHGLQWRNAPPAYGPHKTLDNRFVRLSRMGVFDRIFAALATEAGPPSRLMTDATHLKAHRTAASLRKKGLFPAASGAAGRVEREAPRRLRRSGAPRDPAPHGGPGKRSPWRRADAAEAPARKRADRRPRIR